MDYLDRMKVERDELHEKIVKLRDFITNKKFDELSQKQKELLINQILAMTRYYSVLVERIVLEYDLRGQTASLLNDQGVNRMIDPDEKKSS